MSSPSWLQVPRFFNAFTRRREIFAGRFAMVGIFAACFWEVITPDHKDILSQITTFFNIAGLNVGNGFSASLLFGLIAWNAVSALAPWSETWTQENQRVSECCITCKAHAPTADVQQYTGPFYLVYSCIAC
jgi:hypothetical protein